MKWIGAALLVLAGISLGVGRISALRSEIELLAELERWIGRIRVEISQRGTTLTAILRKCRPDTACVPDFSAELKRGRSLELAAAAWLERQKYENRQILQDLFGTLGRYDVETQTKACDLAMHQLNERKRSLQQELMEKGNVYQMIPIVLSILITLVLI